MSNDEVSTGVISSIVSLPQLAKQKRIPEKPPTETTL